jgi:type III secretion protein S
MIRGFAPRQANRRGRRFFHPPSPEQVNIMEYSVLNFAAQGMYLVLVLSLPPIAVASIVGLMLSLFQAITQLQEQTLSFGVKLISVGVTLFMISDWFGAEIMKFSREIFDRFHLIV